MAKQTTETPLAIGPAKTANWLGIAEGTVRTMLRNGELPGIKLGKRWLIPVKALEAWVEKQAGE
ncbi:MAG: helix-turn-helix domain-containing protein [Syntrophomonadaceae bacterium]|jgi:excisionase family DNA binding protein|nr:helix-turn-helix domain-containing protein [Clostridia bacterium]MDD4561999.1 helix-turn-helix domain-containing protein [Syntrophomonadaceae bacterium]